MVLNICCSALEGHGSTTQSSVVPRNVSLRTGTPISEHDFSCKFAIISLKDMDKVSPEGRSIISLTAN